MVNHSRRPDEGVVRVFRDIDIDPNVFDIIPLPDITYTDVEVVSPRVYFNPGTGDPNLLILGPDMYEENEYRATAAYLGSGDVLNVENLAIFPNFFEHAFGLQDNDYFRVVAETTGTLDFQIYYRRFINLLPGDGIINVEILDASGDVIAGTATTNFADPEPDDDDDARVRIPAVASKTYYIHVYGVDDAGANPWVVNGYDMSIINTPAPVPYDIELDDIVTTDVVTAVNAGLFTFTGTAADLSTEVDFYNGKYVHFTSGDMTGVRALILDYDGAGLLTVLPTVDLLLLSPADTYQIETHDTGRSQFDDTTRDSTPIVRFRLDDAIYLHDLPGNPGPNNPPDEVIPIPFNDSQTADPVVDPAPLPGADPYVAGYRVAIFDEGTPQQDPTLPQEPVGYARQWDPDGPGGNPPVEGVYVFDFDTDTLDPNFELTNGSHFLSARVQIIDPADVDGDPVTVDPETGFGDRSVSLEIVVDTIAPQVFFGSPQVPLPSGADYRTPDGLHPDSDSGVPGPGNEATFSDRITNDTTPTFFGFAEANSVVRVFVDSWPFNGYPDTFDVFIGETVAVPADGTNQFPDGQWELTSNVDLNDPEAFRIPLALDPLLPLPIDGYRPIIVTAEDPAGNVSFLDGNFDLATGIVGLLNGDEVALYTGSTWWFDTDHDFMVDTPLSSSLIGLPIVGDFDGDGFDDLGTWADDIFSFDLSGVGATLIPGLIGLDGTVDAQINFGFIGVRERPVAADLDQDGIDDIGLFVPDRTGQPPAEIADWYFLLSGGDYDGQDNYLLPPLGPDGIAGVRVFGTVNTLDHPFEPVPFGDDLFANFGDEFAAPIIGNFDPPTAPNGGDPETLVLTGSATVNDTFELIPDGAGAWSVVVNGGDPQVVPAEVTRVEFDGLGGDDTVIFNGTDDDESAELWSDHGEFQGSITVSVSNVESITANMGGGIDSVVMHGTDDVIGMEELHAWPDAAEFTGPSLALAATGFESLSAEPGAGPLDTAFLHGSAGADHFYTDPVQARLTDQGGVAYELVATDFPYAHGYGENGNDTAEMHDAAQGAASVGDESVYAYDNLVKMIGETSFFFRRAKHFGSVTAYATGHDPDSLWGDAAYLRDGVHDDEFAASPEQGTMEYNVVYPGGVKTVLDATVTVLDFDYVHGYAIHGGTDTAYLTDSLGDDTAISTPWYTKLFNEVDPHEFFVRAKYFEHVHADASAGNDVALMFDSDRRDTFYGGPDSSSMVGVDYDYNNRVRYFDEVYAYAEAGGFDTAELSDAALSKDHLEAGGSRLDPAHWAKVYSDAADFLYYIEGFERASADSTDAEDQAHFDAGDEMTEWLYTDGWL